MTHVAAWERLPDLLVDRDDCELLAHVNGCHLCQQQIFRLRRVDRLLRVRVSARRRASAWPRVAAVAVAVAAASAIAFAALTRAPLSSAGLALRAGDGTVVAHAQIERGDGENETLRFIATGLPAEPVDTYRLWTRSPESGRPILVGRFMVSRNGECRARFNLAGTQHTSRFWVTPDGGPATIVAST